MDTMLPHARTRRGILRDAALAVDVVRQSGVVASGVAELVCPSHRGRRDASSADGPPWLAGDDVDLADAVVATGPYAGARLCPLHLVAGPEVGHMRVEGIAPQPYP